MRQSTRPETAAPSGNLPWSASIFTFTWTVPLRGSITGETSLMRPRATTLGSEISARSTVLLLGRMREGGFVEREHGVARPVLGKGEGRLRRLRDLSHLDVARGDDAGVSRDQRGVGQRVLRRGDLRLGRVERPGGAAQGLVGEVEGGVGGVAAGEQRFSGGRRWPGPAASSPARRQVRPARN